MHFIRFRKNHCFTIFFIIYVQYIPVNCDEDQNDAVVIGTLKKRDQIPLNVIRRRYSQGELNYRRTKDIREEDWNDNKVYQRYLKMSEQGQREALNSEALHNLDKLHKELNWFNVDYYS